MSEALCLFGVRESRESLRKGNPKINTGRIDITWELNPLKEITLSPRVGPGLGPGLGPGRGRYDPPGSSLSTSSVNRLPTDDQLYTRRTPVLIQEICGNIGRLRTMHNYDYLRITRLTYFSQGSIFFKYRFLVEFLLYRNNIYSLY